MRRQSFRPRPIDVYKKLNVVRSAEDLTFTDEAGVVQRVAKLDDIAGIVEAQPRARKRVDIPTPIVNTVSTYDKEHPNNYQPPVSYIRLKKRVAGDEDEVEYDLDYDDEEWLRGHPKYGEDGDPRYQLDQATFERMIDLLEKANGKNHPPTLKLSEAEEIFNLKLGIRKTAVNRVTEDVFNYWLAKTLRLKKPLLRRFWPQTALNDTNPHHVFRPREKERYKLRKHRKNDMESYRKLLTLRGDFERSRELLALIKRRESMKRLALDYVGEVFEQSIYDLVNTSGKPRKSELREDFKLRLKIPKASEEERLLKKLKRKHKKHKKERKDGKGVDDEGEGEMSKVKTAGADLSKVPQPVPAFTGSGPDAGVKGGPSPAPGANLTGTPNAIQPSFMDYDGNISELCVVSTMVSCDTVPIELDLESAPFTASHVGLSPSFVCRGRMGRGGRFIIDRLRIPPRRRGLNGLTEVTAPPTLQYYPPIPTGPDNQIAHAPWKETGLAGLDRSLIKSIPTVSINPTRLQEIYGMSDGEEEKLEWRDYPPLEAEADVIVKYRLSL